jgi:hypothetical protein
MSSKVRVHRFQDAPAWVALAGDISREQEDRVASLKLVPELVDEEVVGFSLFLWLTGLRAELTLGRMFNQEFAQLFQQDVVRISSILENPVSTLNIMEHAIADMAQRVVRVKRRGDLAVCSVKFAEDREYKLRCQLPWSEVVTRLGIVAEMDQKIRSLTGQSR